MRLCWALVLLTLLPALPAAADQRGELLARASVWIPGDIPSKDLWRGPAGPGGFSFNETVHCHYLKIDPDGNSPKFKCRLAAGDEVKVKYGGGNGEVYAEVAAARLLWALGFGADRMYSVRVRCQGCPENIGVPAGPDGERLVEPAAIERRFTGQDLDDDVAGWSWMDLNRIDERAGGASRAQRDALKLLAVMIQHTDTKPEQQRLTCLDAACTQPFMLLNDVGLTFGRASFANLNAVSSANLKAWAAVPVWKDERGCIGNLPKSFTGTLRDPIITEAGRAFLAGLLQQLSDRQLHDLFTVSQLPYRTLDEGRAPRPTADEWVRTFRSKQAQIAGRRCPGDWSAQAPPLLGTGPVHWVQSWASTPLTVVMNAVSLLGYMRVYLFIGVVLSVSVMRHRGVALLLLLAITAVLTDAAKSAAAMPRPDGVDSSVRTLSLTSHLDVLPGPIARLAGGFHREQHHVASADDEDSYGFPSGHVAAATAFFAGLALFVQWRPAWLLLSIWVPLMALSRLYLGRHFPIDLLGGVAIGVVATAFAWRLRLHLLDHPVRGRNIALRMCGLGVLIGVISLTLRLPAPADAGRLIGCALGALLIVRSDSPLDAHSTLVRTSSAVCAVMVLSLTWWIVPHALAALGQPAHQGIGAWLTGALPLLLALLAPWLVTSLPIAAVDPGHVRSQAGSRSAR